MNLLVILGNSNHRFSGVTSTMLQTLPYLERNIELAVLGVSHLPEGTPTLTYRDFLKLPNTRQRVFHARRNNEMIQALVAKRIFQRNLRIVFTSTAQRHHTRFTKWLIRQMDGVLSTCAAAASYLERPPDRIIPHGVDLERYHPAANREEAWAALKLAGRFGIGIFGRVRPQKGTHLLVRAAIPILRENPYPTVVIVGETTREHQAYQEQLEGEISKAGLSDRIVFLGKRPFNEIPILMRAMSIVAALSDNEGFGLTVLEGMASGCAVLATDAGAWPEIIQENVHGFIVPRNDLPSITEKLTRMMSNPDTLTTMGSAGREHVARHYSVEREGAELLDFYRGMLAREG